MEYPTIGRDRTSGGATPSRIEAAGVKLVRHVLQRWPFPRGKGVVLRCFRSFAAGQSPLFEIESGLLIPLDLEDYIVRYAFTDGYIREPEVQLSRCLVRPGDTVIDIGAHVGLWVMGAALRAGPEGRVHAFEPVSTNFERLILNLERNGLDFVHCHREACSSTDGWTTIYASSNGNSGMASLAGSDGVDIPQPTSVTTLDGFCSRAGLYPVDFLKLDVEGSELEVFRGASGILSSNDAPAILFEVGKRMAARFGSSCERVKSLLQEYGYGVYSYRGAKLEPVAASVEHEQADLFALKPAHFHKYPRLGDLTA